MSGTDPNPNPSLLDPGQIIKRAFDGSTDRIRVETEIATVNVGGQQEIVIDDAHDSIKVGNGSGTYLAVNSDGSINITFAGGTITSLSGDVVATGVGAVTATIQPNVVSNSKLAQMPANTIKGNNVGSTQNATDLTVSQVNTMLGLTNSATSIGSLDAQATNANGLALVSNVLSAQSADATHPGLVNNTTQTFSGNKTFTGTIGASNFTGTHSGSSSGSNTGDQTITLTGDVTGSGTGSFATTLATVNANIGSFGTASSVGTHTVNAKGLITAASNTPIQITESQVTNLVSDLAGKQSTGNYITSLTGDITASGPGASASTISVGVVTDTKASLATKPAVALVSVINTVLSGFQTIDGVTTAANTLVLLTAQTSGAENGPWQAQSGSWTRPTWYPSGGTTQAFQFITTLIRIGTMYQGSLWRQTASGAITIDTTPTTWSQSPLALNSSSVTGTLPAAQLPAFSGDITTSAGSSVATISTNVVSNTKLAQMPANTIKGNNTAGTANSADLTTTQVATLIGAITTVGSFGSASNSNGAVISGSTLTLEPASASFPGGVSTTTQTFAGSKTIGSNASDQITLGAASSTAIHQTNGGMNVTTRTTTSDLTIDTTTTDYIIFCNQSASISLTLPLPTNGRILRIKDISGTADTNTITLVRHASEKIEGLTASRELRGSWDSWTVTSNGTDWFLI